MSKENLQETIQNKAEEKFRNYYIENEIVAYIARKSPKQAMAVNPEWFSTEVFVHVIRVLKEKRTYMSQDLLTLEIKDLGITGDEFEVLSETLDDVYNLDLEKYTDQTFKELVTQLVNMYDSRRVFTAMAGVVTKMNSFSLERDRKSLAEAIIPTVLRDEKHGGFYVDDYEERVEIIQERARQRVENDVDHIGIPSGIKQFDAAIGGVMSGEFMVIGGRTGIGKTAALIHHAITSWKFKNNTLLVSGEMTKHAMEFRIDSNVTAIPSTLFRLSELEQNDYALWENTMSNLRDMHNDSFLYVRSYPKGFSAEDIERDIHWLQDETGEKVDTLCMDYLNIMRPRRGRGKTQEWSSQAEAVWDFKELILDFDMAGFTANQIKDEAYNKRFLDSSDMKYARAISEAAPIIVGLTQCDEDRLMNRMVYQPIKTREATPPKPIYLNPRMDIMRINNELIHSVSSLSDIKSAVVDVDKEKSKKKKRKIVKEL
jgi:hypothetical protein